jgi:hypothetical protein
VFVLRHRPEGSLDGPIRSAPFPSHSARPGYSAPSATASGRPAAP